MKKTIAIIMALAMATTASISASATSVDQSTTANGETSFSFEYKYDPTYTVEIPESVQMSKQGTQVDIKAENVANLDNQKVSVTIAGTDYYRNQMVLDGNTTEGPKTSMRYQFVLPDETVVETTGQKDQVNGVELASFTEDGTSSFTVKPVLAGNIKQGVTYSGTMKYAVELVSLS